jgi:hypothetical protein
MSKTYQKGFAAIGQIMGAGNGASTLGAREGAPAGPNRAGLGRDPADIRIECLKLASGEGGPTQMVVERAQAYLDFIAGGRP